LLRDCAIQNGLDKLLYGVDEGRILADFEGKELCSRVVGHGYQGAADARQFKDMVENDITWFTTWCLNTEMIWGGIDTVGTNLSKLGFRMADDKYLSIMKSGAPVNENDEVDGIGGYNSATQTAHFMFYNFNGSMDALDSETIRFTVNNIAPASGNKVVVKKWLLDDNHGNWWPTWWKDQQKKGFGDENYNGRWSRLSVEVPQSLVNQEDRDFWYSKEAEYMKLAEMRCTLTEFEVSNGSITLESDLEHHGVVFYEISDVRCN
jgi:hypothetical protein